MHPLLTPPQPASPLLLQALVARPLLALPLVLRVVLPQALLVALALAPALDPLLPALPAVAYPSASEPVTWLCKDHIPQILMIRFTFGSSKTGPPSLSGSHPGLDVFDDFFIVASNRLRRYKGTERTLIA